MVIEISVSIAVAKATLNITFIVNLIHSDAELWTDVHDPLLVNVNSIPLEYAFGDDS